MKNEDMTIRTHVFSTLIQYVSYFSFLSFPTLK